MAWLQRRITIPSVTRGMHLITDKVTAALPELGAIEVGLCNIFITHTSASLTINEKADPDVRKDLETVMNRLVPESATYVHDAEGADDMPAHAKASIMGASLTIPISEGKLCLGTWQGIYLCEHRDHGGPRKLVLTVQGVHRDGHTGLLPPPAATTIASSSREKRGVSGSHTGAGTAAMS